MTDEKKISKKVENVLDRIDKYSSNLADEMENTVYEFICDAELTRAEVEELSASTDNIFSVRIDALLEQPDLKFKGEE
jgi:hypothetical protein